MSNSTLYNKSLHVFDKYRESKNIEIEFRFGWFGNMSTFTSDISKFHYDSILYQLQSCNIWNDYKYITTEEKTYHNNLRHVKNLNDNSIHIMNKYNIYTNNIYMNGTPFDVRLSVNKEYYNQNFIDCSMLKETYKVIKYRHSFIYKMWSYDLTHRIIHDDYLYGNDHRNEYNFELEFLPANCYTNEHTNEYLATSVTEKIIDITNIPNFEST